MHVWQFLGQQTGQKAVYLGANITGPKGAELNFYTLQGLNFGQTLWANSSVGAMNITAQAFPDSTNQNLKRVTSRFFGKRVGGEIPTMPLLENGPVKFKMDKLEWETGKNTTEVACSVGGFQNGNALDQFLGLLDDPAIQILPVSYESRVMNVCCTDCSSLLEPTDGL